MECCFILEKTRFCFILMKFLFNVAGFRWSRTCSFKTTARKKKAKKMCYFIKRKIATKNHPRYLKKSHFYPKFNIYWWTNRKKTLRHKKIKLIYLQILLKKFLKKIIVSPVKKHICISGNNNIYCKNGASSNQYRKKKTLKQFFKKSQ